MLRLADAALSRDGGDPGLIPDAHTLPESHEIRPDPYLPHCPSAVSPSAVWSGGESPGPIPEQPGDATYSEEVVDEGSGHGRMMSVQDDFDAAAQDEVTRSAVALQDAGDDLIVARNGELIL